MAEIQQPKCMFGLCRAGEDVAQILKNRKVVGGFEVLWGRTRGMIYLFLDDCRITVERERERRAGPKFFKPAKTCKDD